MANILRDYVTKLTDAQRLEIVADFEQFEREGAIGDCALRQHATKVVKLYGAGIETITVWMRDLAFEIYRWYAGIVIRELRG